MRADRSFLKTAAMVICVGLVFVAVVLVSKFVIGTLLFSREMACSEGEAPANDIHGARACFPEGTELPEGFAWDVRGNYKIN